ncbi:TPA: DUF551 domain-containing protein [Klebsiella pneumoniae subsp. pneumoniae]|nr:DUF551 domain-containing protein [Klebsiella pneumoniae subsp. pneumoniae]
MTKSTITDKRVTSVIERLEHYACNLKWTNVRGAQDLLAAADGLRELQERRKADSEPVAWTWHYREQWHVTNDKCRAEFVAKDGDVAVLPLYSHAQQAVVPDDVLEALQKVARIRLDMNDFDGDRRGIADCLGDAEEALIEVVNRRAAMLAAAPQSPGSEPATVPGTWIPVNERLPEAGGDMIVFTDGIVMSGVSYAKKKGFYIQALEYDDDEPVDSVTHWMPLPAAPQEVKDAHH